MGERQNNLLREIVESYVKNVKPVGSKSLCEKFNCSSATIRNDMAYLEELGYLEKTHTSSGRIPSEKGYHYYVENLMKPKEITGDDMLKLQTILNNKELNLSDAITKAMEIIADLTNYTSVVLGHSSKENTLKQINIVSLGNNKIVAVIITNTGHVENKQVSIPSNINVNEVIKTSEIINKELEGTPIDEVASRLEYEIKPVIANTIEKYEQIYSMFYETFREMTNNDNNDIFFGRKTNILKQPEYNEAEKVKDMISKLEDVDLVKRIETDDNKVNIYIGDETEFDPNVTIIKTAYNVAGTSGTIAIIGPKRMEYERVVTLLNFLKDYIER